jgi:putative ATPase
LQPSDVAGLIDRAFTDPRGVTTPKSITTEARDLLAERCGGDARLALNALEVAALIASGRGADSVDLAAVEEALQRRVIRYDRAGDQHYDVISAFIKSVRGSDPDAAAYWLRVMLDAGEDPEFIARRLVILASEDVGLADSRGLLMAVAASHALAFVGLPEASYALFHATLYLATAPKSNSVARTISAAAALVAETPGAEVPPHLRSTGYRGAEMLGHGVGYLYPHDHPGGIVAQQYLPDAARGRVLYRPGHIGAEGATAERLAELDRSMGRPPRE